MPKVKAKVGFFYNANYAATSRTLQLQEVTVDSLASANGAGAQCCSYNTHHRSNQPNQAFSP